jgi:hypothetical protein
MRQNNLQMKRVQYTANMALESGGCGGTIMPVNHDTTVRDFQYQNNVPVINYCALLGSQSLAR